MNRSNESIQPISVADYISVINELLVRINFKVIGEISELKTASSGHVYFSLKDEKTGDLLNCALWSSVYRMCGVKIENGMKVILSGNADVYRARGTLTFKVKTVELAGEGALKKAYDELKDKLLKEGLFEEERKRKLPAFPQRIGVITSLKGAAIHDFVNNIGKFGIKVFLCDSRVEGQEAVEDLLRSLKVMKSKNLDLLVIIRGGGSLQSLMAFDNEALVREIAEFPVPVLAGIGHHEDVTLVALTADASESTPTAAANRVAAGYTRALDAVLLYQRRIESYYAEEIYRKKEKVSYHVDLVTFFFEKILKEYRESENKIRDIILRSSYLLENKKEKIKNMERSIFSEFRTILNKNIFELKRYSEIVQGNDPERQLRLGYAIIKKEGKILKSVKNVKENEEIESSFYDGKVSSIVKKIKKND